MKGVVSKRAVVALKSTFSAWYDDVGIANKDASSIGD